MSDGVGKCTEGADRFLGFPNRTISCVARFAVSFAVPIASDSEDDWRPGPGITFREHEGCGFWRSERWEEW